MESTLSFSFRAAELTAQLKQAFNETLTGYWQIQLAQTNGTSSAKFWYLAVVQGRVIFSGTEKLSWASFIKTLHDYISRLQNAQSKQAFQQLQHDLSSEKTPSIGKIMVEMQNLKLLSHDDVIQALRLKILLDMDAYMFEHSGKAYFIPEPELLINAPIRGFELSNLLLESMNRQIQWKQMQSYFPSLDSILILKPEAVESSHMTAPQKQQLHNLVKQGRTLKAIAQHMGKDPLEVAKTFILVIKRGLVEVIKSETNSANTASQPEIFIVDDSPILVQQFRHLVVSWGYRVNYSNNALTAVQSILDSNPAAIFLDINMPGASGFDLIKLIRRQPQLSSIPLVLLTAEKTVSNQWRAQWASCKFLAKPRTPAETSIFQTELRQMLGEMAPLAKGAVV